MVFTPVTITSVAEHAHGAYDWLTEEEKTRAWFTDGSAH